VLKLSILDLLTAMAVGIWIMKAGFDIFMETSRELMDGSDNPELYYRIFDAVEEVGGANPHRVRIRKHSNLYTVDLDIEIDGKLSIKVGHDIAQKVEDKIKERIENVYDVLVHIEPEGNVEKEKFGLSRANIDAECNKKNNAK
jgi:divalent metal cation (Fe/Co/Zn/Cd) transporter